MALLSELIQVCAKHRVDSEPTLTLFGRRLREAGRVSTSGRGRGAAHMTNLDAARFLIACAATDRPEQAADAELVFSNLLRSEAMSTDDRFPLPASEFSTLDTALAEVLRVIGVGEVSEVAKTRWAADHPTTRVAGPAFTWLIVNRGGGGAELRVLNGRYLYHHPALVSVIDSVQHAYGKPATDIASEAFERDLYRFQTGKNLTAELSGGLLNSVASLIAGREQ